MQSPILEEKTTRKISWRKILRAALYFGVPIFIAVSSAAFPIRLFLRQLMVGFMIIWFVAGSWLFNTPK